MTLSIMSFSQNEWRLYKSVSGVNIYTKNSDCYFKDGNNMNQTVVLFKLENTTGNKITIQWDLRVWYNGVEAVNNTTPGERHVSFSIDANSSLEADCSLKKKNLYLYKKYLDFEKSKTLTKFVLENLRVS